MSHQNKGGKNFFIHTLGCKVNQYESQAMREILLKAGFKECFSKGIADIYIVNTCTVTNRADKESRYVVGMLHRANPNARIVVTGCYVEKDASELSFLPGISNVVKNSEKGRIADILNGRSVLSDTGLDHQPAARSLSPKEEFLSITDFKDRSKAFVKIQDGCDNFCSYCKVPLVRGPSRSKSISDIAREVKELTGNGFREIVLTGICLGAWGTDMFPDKLANDAGLGRLSLVDVLKVLNDIHGDFRIRLSSIEPKHVTDELIDFISANKKICRHLHIPLQSGDDEVLKKMNRPYISGEYKSLVDRIRAGVENVAITTDVLVGFPGESDSNFRNTVKFIKSILPSRTHVFTFSRRPGTAAYEMGPSVREEVLKKRRRELASVALGTSYLYRSRFLDKALGVLVETKRNRQNGMLMGYSDNYIKVMFEGSDAMIRKIVPVTVKYVNLMHTLGDV